MPRLVGGTHGGRRLRAPAGSATRPTSDRAREGLFSSLQSLLDLDGARVLDLYAGSGALGLEALSRGAADAVLVERDARALAALRANVADLGMPARVVEADVEAFLGRPAEQFDLVLLDPPYDVDVDPVLARLGPWLAEAAVVVVERGSRGGPPGVPEGWEALRDRRYGEAALWYFRAP
jgi:16S rRNA (guanine966-N2)-methyltransferase